GREAGGSGRAGRMADGGRACRGRRSHPSRRGIGPSGTGLNPRRRTGPGRCGYHHTMPLTVSGAELEHLLELLKGAHSVEIKLTVPESVHSSTLQALEIDPLDARMRRVFFFDPPRLTLNKAGIVVRARRIQDAAADTTVKLRPIVPDEVAKPLRKDPAFTIEVDAMPGGFVCSGSLKAI